jgi:transcription elongation factor Elf1
MGMFDYVYWDCPNCGHRNEEQSKSGECMLNSYDLIDAPISIQADFDCSYLYCGSCNKSSEFKIHKNAGFV